MLRLKLNLTRRETLTKRRRPTVGSEIDGLTNEEGHEVLRRLEGAGFIFGEDYEAIYSGTGGAEEVAGVRCADPDAAAIALALVNHVRKAAEDDACPGCGTRPGDGISDDCYHPEGCGYWREQYAKYKEIVGG